MDTFCTGRLLEREALGSASRYRVVGADDRLVLVEVVDAPGLERGAQIRITRRSARAMREVAETTVGGASPQIPARVGALALG